MRIGFSVMQGRRAAQEDRHFVIDNVVEYAKSHNIKINSPEIESIFRNTLLLGLFDGHMGNKASTFCCRELPLKIIESLSTSNDLLQKTNLADIPEAVSYYKIDHKEVARIFYRCFHAVDKDFLEKFRLRKDGSTAVITLLIDNELYIAWLGDSRAVLGSSRVVRFENKSLIKIDSDDQADHNFFIQCSNETSRSLSSHSSPHLISSSLTVDHKPNRQDEAERIYKAGGAIVDPTGVARVLNPKLESQYRWFKGRINTNFLGLNPAKQPIALAVSRAFGDHDLKIHETLANPLIIATPEVRYMKVDRSRDKFIILACDGIWDVLTEQQTVSLAGDINFKNPNFSSELASEIVKTAFNSGSQDNLTAIVASLS